MKRVMILFSVVFLGCAISGCNPYNKAGEGAAIGGSLGALAGGIVGNQSHHHGVGGALIGGALGAIAGTAVGSGIQKPNPPAPPAPAPAVVVAQPTPVVVEQPAPVVIQPVEAPAVTVNIPNSDGTYTAVVLRRSGYGYMGPQGEYYPHMPSVNQLRAMYGH